tara:strand:- start:318 stop:857 length:540 start_codon:yes stop_codon:yes gene_type:complete
MYKAIKICLFIIVGSLLSADDFSKNKEMIPNVNLKDINKKKVNLVEASKDYYVLINFWNMACEPCKKEMKFLNQFHEKYNEHGFKVISINMDTPRSMSKVKKYVKSSKYSFEVFQDPRMNVFKKMGGSIMPFVVIADNKGNVVNKHIGFNLGDEKSLELEIRELISFKVDTTIESNIDD